MPFAFCRQQSVPRTPGTERSCGSDVLQNGCSCVDVSHTDSKAQSFYDVLFFRALAFDAQSEWIVEALVGYSFNPYFLANV